MNENKKFENMESINLVNALTDFLTNIKEINYNFNGDMLFNNNESQESIVSQITYTLTSKIIKLNDVDIQFLEPITNFNNIESNKITVSFYLLKYDKFYKFVFNDIPYIENEAINKICCDVKKHHSNVLKELMEFENEVNHTL